MWEKGQSGNPEGTRKKHSFYATLDRAITQDDSKRLRDAAEKLLDAAAAGEPWALQMLADRTDGKPKQATEISGPEGGPIEMNGNFVEAAQGLRSRLQKSEPE